ncbi:MAG: demethoxyubiquinone hydroxylase family protein, partial [Parasphingorhabdus sp.]
MAETKLGQADVDIASMIRVNQAGEYGAAQIYKGQLAVMGDDAPHSSAIHHMAEQEQRHLDAFDQMIAERGVRPTALQPFWKVAGYALGATTAAL